MGNCLHVLHVIREAAQRLKAEEPEDFHRRAGRTGAAEPDRRLSGGAQNEFPERRHPS